MSRADFLQPAAGARFRLAKRTAAAMLATLVIGLAAAAEPPPEPLGYRMEEYRAPTPATLEGARRVDTATAEQSWRSGSAVFLDTMPRPEKPANLPAGTIWRDKPRDHIPGSAWLANVGYGALSPEMERYFRTSLETLTAGERSTPTVFYCRSDCWMSWNAAKRAMSWGYRNVAWYSEGTDGWEAAGLPLEPARPYASPPVAPAR